MLDRLPETIDPLVFAERRIELKGKLNLASFSRLEGLLLETTGQVDLELFFNQQGRHSFIEGSASTTLIMACQNCLEAVEVPITVAIRLGVVANLEEADRLPAGYEPLLLTEEKILLREIVEDELLLAIPTFPKHQQACITFTNNLLAETALNNTVTQTTPKNPFAVLAKLKSTGEL